MVPVLLARQRPRRELLISLWCRPAYTHRLRASVSLEDPCSGAPYSHSPFCPRPRHSAQRLRLRRHGRLAPTMQMRIAPTRSRIGNGSMRAWSGMLISSARPARRSSANRSPRRNVGADGRLGVRFAARGRLRQASNSLGVVRPRDAAAAFPQQKIGMTVVLHRTGGPHVKSATQTVFAPRQPKRWSRSRNRSGWSVWDSYHEGLGEEYSSISPEFAASPITLRRERPAPALPAAPQKSYKAGNASIAVQDTQPMNAPVNLTPPYRHSPLCGLLTY
jgi:hypothetical protein